MPASMHVPLEGQLTVISMTLVRIVTVTTKERIKLAVMKDQDCYSKSIPENSRNITTYNSSITTHNTLYEGFLTTYCETQKHRHGKCNKNTLPVVLWYLYNSMEQTWGPSWDRRNVLRGFLWRPSRWHRKGQNSPRLSTSASKLPDWDRCKAAMRPKRKRAPCSLSHPDSCCWVRGPSTTSVPWSNEIKKHLRTANRVTLYTSK